jgi:hypothetical protein
LAIPKEISINVTNENYPYADGDEVWTPDLFQNPDAEIEIVCFDSSYTILKFKDEQLSNLFYLKFDEAIDLAEFNKNN